jgi:competence protein ComEC
LRYALRVMCYVNFPLSNSKIFLFCCIFFIVGIAIASFLPVSPMASRGGPDKFITKDIWWFALLVLCLVLAVLFWQNKIIRLACLAGLFLFLGIWRFSLDLPENAPDKIWFYNGSEVNVKGVIIKEPDVRKNFTKYTVEMSRGVSLRGERSPVITRDKLRNLGESANTTGLLRPFQSLAMTENNISGKILVTTNLYPAHNYGDELEIKCKLKAPEPFNDFAYDKYLARYDIYSVCYYPEIKKVKTRGNLSLRNLVLSKIFSLKNKLSEKIGQGMNEPEASLAKGIILGERANIDQNINDNFSRTGLTHLIAISGMNISILAIMAMNLLIYAGLWRRQAFYLAAIFLFLYIILIGAPASAARALIMGVLTLYALSVGRLSKPTNLLAFAAALMILFNPRILRYDIGFQLSFLAILGIVYFYPKIDGWLTEKGWKKIILARQALSLTLAAQIFTLPIIGVNFSIISLISPLANLLAIWTMPIVMVNVLAVLPLSFIFPNFPFLFFLPAQIILKYLILVAETLAKIPYAYLKFDFKYIGWLAILYYVIVFYSYYICIKRKT